MVATSLEIRIPTITMCKTLSLSLKSPNLHYLIVCVVNFKFFKGDFFNSKVRQEAICCWKANPKIGTQQPVVRQ